MSEALELRGGIAGIRAFFLAITHEKSKSNATKVKLDLYHVKENSYTKLQVNITKDGREKSRKVLHFLQRALTQFKVSQTRQKLNLTCITSRQIHIWNFMSMSGKMATKNPENIISGKSNYSCKSEDKFINQISSQDKKRQERKVRKTKCLQRAITQVKVSQTWHKSNLTCIMWRQIHIPIVKSIFQKTIGKSSEKRVDGHWVDWRTERQTADQTDGLTGRRQRKL